MKCRTVNELIEELNKYQDWDLNLPISVTIDPHGKLLIGDERGPGDLDPVKEDLGEATSYLEDALDYVSRALEALEAL